MIYLDNFTITRPTSKAVKAYQDFEQEDWRDFRSPYFSNTKKINEAVHMLYDFVGAAKEDKIAFFGSEYEASRAVFYHVYTNQVIKNGRNFFAAPCTDNASILLAMDAFETAECEKIHLPVDENGVLTPELLEKHLTPKVAVLALSWANPLTGVIQPVWEIAEICKKRGILVYVQVSEILAKTSFRFQNLPVDFISFSGDLFHAPKGQVVLFSKRENGMQNYCNYMDAPGIYAMAEAAKEFLSFSDSLTLETARLRHQFEEGLLKINSNVKFFGKNTRRLPNVSCFAFPNLHAEALSYYLMEKKLFLSLGGGRVQKLEYVLKAMNQDPLLALCGLSATLSYQTTEQEINSALEIIEETERGVKQLVSGL